MKENDLWRTPDVISINSFAQSIRAPGPAAEYDLKLMLYGQFVGSWEAEAQWLLPDGTTRLARKTTPH